MNKVIDKSYDQIGSKEKISKMRQSKTATTSKHFPSDFFYKRNNQMNEVTDKNNMNIDQLKSKNNMFSNSKSALKLPRKPEKRDSYLSRVTLENSSPC